mmetsp:Transcript_22580/g.42843  ORF Transcript_22580/g.42843 Transcript_22580/m.42843 type:complete len:239 (-) Transcript_22580:385-1101(-)
MENFSIDTANRTVKQIIPILTALKTETETETKTEKKEHSYEPSFHEYCFDENGDLRGEIREIILIELSKRRDPGWTQEQMEQLIDVIVKRKEEEAANLELEGLGSRASLWGSLALATQDDGDQTVPLDDPPSFSECDFGFDDDPPEPTDPRGRILYESSVCSIYKLVAGPNHRDKWITVPPEQACQLRLLLAHDGRILVEHVGKDEVVTYSGTLNWIDDEKVAVQFGVKPFNQKHPDE